MLDKLKTFFKSGSATPLIIIAAVCISSLWLARVFNPDNTKAIEALYQQAQADHRNEYQIRIRNLAKLETAEKESAEKYRVGIAGAVKQADDQIRALKWKTNRDLIAAGAARDEILQEKEKVEKALVIMTGNRDDLVEKAKAREAEILIERSLVKVEIAAAVKAKEDELALCEKARTAALRETGRKTWFAIGPAALATIRSGVVTVAYGVSIQIPLITIRSPFK